MYCRENEIVKYPMKHYQSNENECCLLHTVPWIGLDQKQKAEEDDNIDHSSFYIII